MVLKEVLEEQVKKNQMDIAFYKEQLKMLPKGTLHSIVIKGKRVNYLKDYDDRGKRIERSVEETELEIISSQLRMRKQMELWIQELKEDINVAEKTLQYSLREKE